MKEKKKIVKISIITILIICIVFSIFYIKRRNNYIILSSYLDKILTIYKDINDNYTKDIYYNNKNRTYLLYNIDSNVNNINKTNRSINNLVIPYNSNNKDRIERINYHLYCIKKELELYQNNLEVTTNRIEKNEIEIIAKINNL